MADACPTCGGKERALVPYNTVPPGVTNGRLRLSEVTSRVYETCTSCGFEFRDWTTEEFLSYVDAARRLFDEMPVLHSSSLPEPPLKVRLIDYTQALDTLKGLTHPRDWVHVPCPVLSPGIDPLGRGTLLRFSHGAHHWNDYQDGRDPLRIPHWCNGELEDEE